MMRNPPPLRWPVYTGCALLAFLALLGIGRSINWAIDEIHHGPKRKSIEDASRAREKIHQQIAKHQIDIGDRYDARRGELETAAFLAEMENIQGSFSIRLEGVRDAGAFLHQIRGLPGLKELSFDYCELKDPVAGLEDIATLPDLESLSLSEIRLDGTSIEKLQVCSKLSTLGISYFQDSDVKIADVLALPHLRHLSLDASMFWDSDGWVERCLNDLPKTLTLDALTVWRIKLTPDEVRDLRGRYPNCKIRVFGGNEKEIAPLPKSDRVR